MAPCLEETISSHLSVWIDFVGERAPTTTIIGIPNTHVVCIRAYPYVLGLHYHRWSNRRLLSFFSYKYKSHITGQRNVYIVRFNISV